MAAAPTVSNGDLFYQGWVVDRRLRAALIAPKHPHSPASTSIDFLSVIR
jgi:hypothetical protein